MSPMQNATVGFGAVCCSLSTRAMSAGVWAMTATLYTSASWRSIRS